MHIFIKGHPKRPKGYHQMGNFSDNLQLWSLYGESCSEETVPIRRTKEQDILRAGSISRFGKKLNQVGRDDTSNAHEVCNHKNLFLSHTHIFFMLKCGISKQILL